MAKIPQAWSPFSELDRFRREFDELFGEVHARKLLDAPPEVRSTTMRDRRSWLNSLQKRPVLLVSNHRVSMSAGSCKLGGMLPVPASRSTLPVSAVAMVPFSFRMIRAPSRDYRCFFLGPLRSGRLGPFTVSMSPALIPAPSKFFHPILRSFSARIFSASEFLAMVKLYHLKVCFGDGAHPWRIHIGSRFR
jgi:hypothetical protein